MRGWTLVAALALVASACGTPCHTIREARADFLARGEHDRAPHLALTLPFAVLDDVLAGQLASLPRVSLSAGELGPLGRFLGPIAIAPRSLHLRAAPEGAVGLLVTLDLELGGAPMLSTKLLLHLRPGVERATGGVALRLHAADLREVRPRLSDGAAEKLQRELRRWLPPLARPFVSAAAIRQATDGLLELAVGQGWALARDRLLGGLGEIARLRLEIPGLPLSALQVSSSTAGGGFLHLALVSALPVARGLQSAAPPALADPRRVTLRMAGATVAELANRAMADGALPRRYDAQGQPREDGPFEAGFGWRDDTRPMKIHLWKTHDEPCLQIRLGGTPRVELSAGALRAEVDDLRLEDLDGPARYEVGAFFHSLFGASFHVAGETAAALRVELAGQPLSLQLRRARLADGELDLQIELRPPPGDSACRPPGAPSCLRGT